MAVEEVSVVPPGFIEGLEFKTGRKPARAAEAGTAFVVLDGVALPGGARLVLPVFEVVVLDVAVPVTLARGLAAAPGAALARGVALTPVLAGVTALEEAALVPAADLEEVEELALDRGVTGASLVGDRVT